MKRDMELMRKILFKIEGYSKEVVAEHCDLLAQEYLIKEYEPNYSGKGILSFRICNLTSRGYDYLELFRNEEVWNSTKKDIRKKRLPETIEEYGKAAASIAGAFFREFNR